VPESRGNFSVKPEVLFDRADALEGVVDFFAITEHVLDLVVQVVVDYAI
jgi:hypothetical protein